MIIGFNHTSFTVVELERALAFWSKLGFDGPGIVEREADWVGDVTGVPRARIRLAHVYGYGHHLEFVEYDEGEGGVPTALPNTAGTAHVCLDVRDIHATFEELLSWGAIPLGRMTEINHPGMARCSAGYLRDPNGIIVELLEKL